MTDAVRERNGRADREGLVDLLGLLAYAELVAFFRLSEDAVLAPSLADKAALGRMAVAEFSHSERLRAELERLGADADLAMAPFTGPLDAFHVRTTADHARSCGQRLPKPIRRVSEPASST